MSRKNMIPETLLQKASNVSKLPWDKGTHTYTWQFHENNMHDKRAVGRDVTESL